MLLGSGVDQVVQTTVGPITIPASTITAPKLENTMGATIVTLANENTLSGFELVISMQRYYYGNLHQWGFLFK